MNINKGRCPSCKGGKALRSIKKFRGLDWSGSQCLLCGHFVPDILSEQYDILCDGCGKSLGRRAFDRHFHDVDDEAVRKLAEAQIRNSAAVRADLEMLAKALESEKDPSKASSIKSEIERVTEVNRETLRAANMVPKSWQKRHGEQRRNHFCLDCHEKRRKDGVDFDSVESHVMHEVRCSVCSKAIAFLYVPEHHQKEDQLKEVADGPMNCSGKCTEYAEAVRAEIHKRVDLTPK